MWELCKKYGKKAWTVVCAFFRWFLAKGKPLYVRCFRWFLFCLLVAFCYVAAVEVNLFNLFGYSPSIRELKNPQQCVASEVYADDGRLIGKFFYENRTPVTYEDLSPLLINTLIATEDTRFYEHHGIDFKALLPVIKDMLKGNPRGGSTISQQLVKNLFKTRKQDHGLLGKIPGVKMFVIKSKEWISAVRIEMHFTKEELLTLYFNTVDFGSNSYGIKAAAKTFYNKEPKDLDANECSVLIGMLKAPTAYSPVLNPDRSLGRRNVVLGIMKREGVISHALYDSVVVQPITLHYKVESPIEGIGNYFRQAVYAYLKPWLKENELDIFADGLKIYTTLNYDMQVYAEEAMTQNMKRVQKQFDAHWKNQNPWIDGNKKEIPNFLENVIRKSWYYSRLSAKYKGNQDSIDYYINERRAQKLFSWKGDIDTVCSFVEATNYLKRLLHSGLVAIEPETGAIKAYVGGLDYNHFKYDNVRSMRQPGSSFKTFVYTAAMANGWSPCDSLSDMPITINYVEKGEKKSWVPRNADRTYVNGNVGLKYAFAHSLNTISVQLTQKIGVETVINQAHQMGIKSPLDTVPSICLGSSDVTLLELTDAYCPILNSGYRVEPMFVTRIEDKDGNVLKTFEPMREKVLDSVTVFLMQQMFIASLREPYGTTQNLFSYKLFAHDTDFGGKTGTSSNYSDGWFVGVTPHLVVGSWVGAEERCVHFRTSSLGEGGRTALPMYGLFMEKVINDSAFAQYRGRFPRHLKGLKNRPYSCYTVYVPKNDSTSVDSLGGNTDGVDEEVPPLKN
ncbi:MAG: transglycosylase domain-containing protein [Bacteroidales bacterium]|nr:transglycosylase domain-containing protein [Bacteroidales bacterium]MBR7034407.1 transglycosylase domain-containing protein [Bacteroidales bacterium]